jgi:hypothetical protein
MGGRPAPATTNVASEEAAMIRARLADDIARLPVLVGDDRLRW